MATVTIAQRLDQLPLEQFNLSDGHGGPVLLVENVELVRFHPQSVDSVVANGQQVGSALHDVRFCTRNTEVDTDQTNKILVSIQTFLRCTFGAD